MELTFDKSSDFNQWDNHLLKYYKYPHPYQSLAFYEYLNSFPNFYSIPGTPECIYICKNGEIIGQCLISISKEKDVSWHYGPVIRTEYLDIYNNIVSKFIDYLKKCGLHSVYLATTQIVYTNDVYIEDLNLYSYTGETCFVDLWDDINIIYNSFDHSVRKNIKKCQSEGVNILINSDVSMIPIYLEMLTSHRRSMGFTLPPFYPNHDTMKIFSRPNTSMEIAYAIVDEKYLAGMGFVTFGDVVTEIAVAQSDDYSIVKLPLHDMIKVTAIEYYKNKGIRYYDITGGIKNTKDPKEKNINRFKRKFGKHLANFGMINQKKLNISFMEHIKEIWKML